ncbi:nucleotidyltransferase family protein [Arcticibacterium luteifluviistationis]|uniref:4-diphosphocytidyl-2C-methyl-D-erythritol synthase n=1 Tax=Arcticibacterium luteifluviistationis TaxID=1784714 RepID=A0A2Z4G723_9BACT|nr:nucleotidyltransferase family protein [Arcticibacterium luteifluviistationis]AWV96976.1 4-diphosphocytidyl-2C-methyl-D-erythritol synthase [Arcticibacterium luteifluviistationis]
MNVGIIILAAGASQRMGVPKQLLDIRGDLLVVKAIKECLKVDNVSVSVVLGANKQLIIPKLKEFSINIVENTDWASGMAGSIVRGLAGSYMLNKNIDAVLVCAADMPEISGEYLTQMIKEAETNPEIAIVASSYQKVLGVPALFKKETFIDLLELKGDKGASQIFKKYKSKIKKIDFEGLGIDLDTKEDYLQYINAKN